MSGIEVWQCIGCGRIDAPQPCLGICQDRRTMVYPESAHQALQSELSASNEQLRVVHDLLRQLAHSQPKAGHEAECLAVFRAAALALLRPSTG